MRHRRNADEDVRQRGRAATSGDPEDLASAARARRRAGEDVLCWELDPIGQIFLQSFLLGREGRVEAKLKGGKVERFYVAANRLPDRGILSRGPMYPFADRWPFYDWRPWVERECVVVVPQTPVQVNTNGPLDTLYKIATSYNLTPDEVWDANAASEVGWPDTEAMGDPISLRGLHPHWTEWTEERQQGTRPPAAWATGHYGAWIDATGFSYPERWRFSNLYDPWIQSGTVGSWGTPHWMTVPPSGRWSVLFRASAKLAGRNDEFGDRGSQDANALRPGDYEWARVMTKKGKRWKNPVRRNADERMRELERAAAGGDPDAKAALDRWRERTKGPDPVTPSRGCYEIVPDPEHPGWVWPHLDGKRISTVAWREGDEGIEHQIDYDVGERARHPWWYESIERLHYPTDRCWEIHFPPPRYLHPKPKRRVRRRRPGRGYRVLENPDSADRALRQAARILAASPGLLHQFLVDHVGLDLKPTLFVDDSSGYDNEEDVMWSGSPEAWKQYVEERREMGVGEPEPWNWRLVLGTELASGYRDVNRPMRPYERSMEVLRERGWASNPRPNPSADHTLRQAARILAADPGLMDGFLDMLLYDGKLPRALIHKIHNELMRYDLLEKLGTYATLRQGPGGLETTGIFGTETRAFAGAAGEGANIAARHRFLQLAEQMETLLEQGYEFMNQEDDARARAAFAEALRLYNTSVPNAQIAVQRMLIE